MEVQSGRFVVSHGLRTENAAAGAPASFIRCCMIGRNAPIVSGWGLPSKVRDLALGESWTRSCERCSNRQRCWTRCRRSERAAGRGVYRAFAPLQERVPKVERALGGVAAGGRARRWRRGCTRRRVPWRR